MPINPRAKDEALNIDRLRILFLEKVMSCPVQEVVRGPIPAVDISVFLA